MHGLLRTRYCFCLALARPGGQHYRSFHKAQQALLTTMLGLKTINGTLNNTGTANGTSSNSHLTFTDSTGHLCIKGCAS